MYTLHCETSLYMKNDKEITDFFTGKHNAIKPQTHGHLEVRDCMFLQKKQINCLANGVHWNIIWDML